MRLYRQWLLPILALLTLNSCISPQPITDHVIYGWEYPAGGAVACVKVHTLFTDIAPVHLGLNDCFAALQGAVFLQGSDYNTISTVVDTFCAETGACTYEQEQAMASLKLALARVHRKSKGNYPLETSK